MTSVWTYSRHTPIHCHSGGTLGHDLCSASYSSLACVCLRTHVFVTEALYGGVLLTLLTVSFHMEINEEAPLIHCHIYSGMNRECRLCREFTTKKAFSSYYFMIVSTSSNKAFKKQTCYFLSAVCTRRHIFS